MPRKKTDEQGDKAQVTAFRKAARDLDCEDNEERFNEALRAIGKKKPRPRTKPEAERNR
jgi:hypothetical protein